MNVDPFSFLLASLPIGLYIAWIALIRLTGRCWIISSSREWFVLAAAASGMIAAGPAQLFFPTSAASVFGPRVWLAVALLILLVTTLITLVARPSIVVYGRNSAETYPALLAAAQAIDPECVGSPRELSVRFEKYDVALRCEGRPDHDATRIVSFAPAYGPAFWKHLMRHLRDQGIPRREDRSAGGAGALLLAIAMVALAIGWR